MPTSHFAVSFNTYLTTVEWFDFDAQIGLISPRPCIIIAGIKDHIWPYKGALKVVQNFKKVFKHDSIIPQLVI